VLSGSRGLSRSSSLYPSVAITHKGLQTLPAEGHRLNPSHTAEPMAMMKQLHRQRSKRRWRIQAHGRYQRYATNSMAAGYPTASVDSFWPCALCPRVLGTDRRCSVSGNCGTKCASKPALAWWNGSRNLPTLPLTSLCHCFSLVPFARRSQRYFWTC